MKTFSIFTENFFDGQAIKPICKYTVETIVNENEGISNVLSLNQEGCYIEFWNKRQFVSKSELLSYRVP